MDLLLANHRPLFPLRKQKPARRTHLVLPDAISPPAYSLKGSDVAFRLPHAGDPHWPYTGLPLRELVKTFQGKRFVHCTDTCTRCGKRNHTANTCTLLPSTGPDSPFFDSLRSFRPHVQWRRGRWDDDQMKLDLLREARSLNIGNPFSALPDLESHSLKKNLGFWRAINTPPLQLSWIAHGYKLRFLAPPPMVGFKNHAGATRERGWVSEQIATHLKKGHVSRVDRSFAKVINPLDTVPKANGKLRMILDCRLVNGYLPHINFRLENLSVLPHLMHHKALMFTTDLESAYFHIPMHPDSRPYLCFEWEGLTYCMNVLPFGLSLAPYIFTKTLRPVVSFVRSLDVTVLAYLDDFLWSADDNRMGPALRLVALVRWIFARLGFAVSEPKSAWTPSAVITFLGLIFDSDEFAFYVPQSKLTNIQSMFAKALDTAHAGGAISAKEIARLCGHLLALRLAVTPARVYSRALYAMLSDAAGWDNSTTFSTEAIDELEFWVSSLSKYNGRPATPLPSEVILFTDASDVGWGAHVPGYRGAEALGTFDEATRTTSSTHRELTALHAALHSTPITLALQGQRTTFILDSRAAVANLNKGGGPVAELSKLTKRIWKRCVELSIDARAEWVPREYNLHADQLSRCVDREDWSLSSAAFDKICTELCQPDVDRFAAAHNTKCARFNSRFYDPAAEGVDAFAQNWSPGVSFCNPPWDQLQRTITHAEECKAKILLVYPLWHAATWIKRVRERAEKTIDLGRSASILTPGPRSLPLTPTARKYNILCSLLQF